MAASTKDMSAQQAQHTPVRLLIAERSENTAYQFDSLLRDAGIATRPEIIDLPMAVDKLAHADMMLCNTALPELNQLLPRLISLAPHVPIILVSNEDAPLTTTEGMELGAADVVTETDSRHLVLAVKRELEHVCRNIQYRQMKKALAEAEQRCQLLLESSRAAIAYVHEGMHVHANEHYLKLFGFDDADDLLGLPLIDLMASDSVATLKETLKAFRVEEAETEFDFSGVSTNGDTVAGSMALAAADYEGEHCLQVTVRPLTAAHANLSLVTEESVSVSEAEADQNGAALDPADDVPVLDTQAIVAIPGDAATESTDNDATMDAADADIDQEVDGIDFELELERGTDVETSEPTIDEPAGIWNAHEAEVVEPDTTAAAEDQNAKVANEEAADVSEDAADVSEDAAEVSEDAVSENTTTKFGRILSLPEFLTASEAVASEHERQFVSVFVAQVDGYEDLQRTFGLAGVDDACRKVESALLER
ncbi:MAG: response regulator, partial [Gammaproteobacteria bacterium]